MTLAAESPRVERPAPQRPPRQASVLGTPRVLVPALTVLAAVILSCFALGGLYDDSTWVGPTVLTVLAVVGAGAAAVRVRLPVFLVPIVQAAALFAVLVALYTDDAPWGFVPTPDSMASLREVLGEGMAAIERYAPPVPVSDGVAAVTALGMGGVALVVFVLAVVLRLPTLAGTPLLAVYLVPAFVLDAGASWVAFVAVVVGWLALVVVDERTTLHTWGQVLRRSDRARGSSPASGLSSAALRLGVLAIAFALALPVLIPGLADAVLGRGGSGDGSGTGSGSSDPTPTQVDLDALVSLRRDLLELPDVPVLRYTTTAEDPSYLRGTVLEVYDGETFAARELSPTSALPVTAGLPSITLNPDDPGSADTYEITSEALVSRFLPLPSSARAVEVSGAWYADSSTGTVFADGTDTRGGRWLVTTGTSPTPQQLAAAPEVDPQRQAELAAATDIPAEVAATAREVTAGTTSDYEAAVALQDWFTSEFTYSTDVASEQSGDYLTQFLTDRIGYCEQFAATMALMARSLGIPANVVVGFTAGSRGQDGSYVVSTKDAHAWPELFFTGIGWVAFEPTPAGSAGGDITAPGYTTPAPTTPDDRRTPLTDGEEINPRQVAPEDDEAGADVAALAAPTASDPDAWRTRALGLLALAALVAALVPAVLRWSRRRRRLAGSVEDAWAEVRDTALDLGLPWSDARTPRQAVTGMTESTRLAGEPRAALERLGRATEQTRYAASAPRASHAAEDARTVRAALLRRAETRDRWRALLWPASLRRT
jgi:transglutaminase-like putative cysteine protease